MRAIVLLLVATLAAAETSEPAAETVTFTRAQLQQLENDLNAMVMQREEAAFKRGQSDVRQRCASLI